MIDLTALSTKVDALGNVVTGIKADYTFLIDEVTTLKAALAAAQVTDPAVQASVDAIAAKLDASLQELTTLDASVTPTPSVPV